MPQQPKGKARNNHTTQPPLLLPFQWPGLSLWQAPPYFLSIISPPSAHPHGPACHCGRSRLATNTPNPLPSHLYTQPSVIPTFKARLVIVAGPALRPTPPIHFHPIFIPNHQSSPLLRPGLSLWQVPPHQYPPPPFSPLLPSLSFTCFHFSRRTTRLATIARLPLFTCFPPHPPSSYPLFGPACHCGRSRQIPLLTLPAPLPFWIPPSILCLYFGPACHCGRSRLLHPHCLPLHLLLSLSSATPF